MKIIFKMRNQNEKIVIFLNNIIIYNIKNIIYFECICLLQYKHVYFFIYLCTTNSN